MPEPFGPSSWETRTDLDARKAVVLDLLVDALDRAEKSNDAKQDVRRLLVRAKELRREVSRGHSG